MMSMVALRTKQLEQRLDEQIARLRMSSASSADAAVETGQPAPASAEETEQDKETDKPVPLAAFRREIADAVL